MSTVTKECSGTLLRLLSNNNLNEGPISSIVAHATIVTETFLRSRDCSLRTSIDLGSPCLEIAACVFGYGLLLFGRVSECSETVQVRRVCVFE
jgi:hypothetical protein